MDWKYFDFVPDRTGTDCEKWDARESVFHKADVIPLWVADMDLPCAEEIVQAMTDRARHPIYGYTEENPRDKLAEVDWLYRRFHLHVEPEWILFSPSVVDSMLFCLRALTQPEDLIVIQTPVYGPFRETVLRTGRKLAENPLLETPQGWKMDLQGLEQIFRAGAKMLFLCSPHNPVGRVWTREELSALNDLTERYGVTVVSDEIHASFTFDGRKNFPFLRLSQRAIMLTSATKAFNLAGLRHSSMLVPDARLREKLLCETHSVNADRPNLFGALAQRTAYDKGDAWLDACVGYIQHNRDIAEKFFSERVPRIQFHPLEGTYLMWLDLRGIPLSHEALFRRLVEVGNVGLNDGLFFGEAGRKHFRLNLATQTEILLRGLEGIERAINTL